jgi:Uncharacterized protein conserved in bacteria
MTRLILQIFLIQFFLFGLANMALCKKTDLRVSKALKLVQQNSQLLGSVGQLIVVFTEDQSGSSATMIALEKKNNRWKAASDVIDAGIGRNGFAAPGQKREGDGKSPTGLFSLGQLFGYEKSIDTRMPHRQTSTEDKWIDDPDSPDYNKYVRGNTTAKSFENLKISTDEYKLCMVINYNTNPVVKGMGSAIFLHLSFGDSPNSSSGCVVITPEKMEKLLKWMKPELNPSILMGTEDVLMRGIK